jgi:cold-inducible RNA-binding protein
MGTKLYIGNLSYSTTEETLRAAFAADGRTVTEVSIITDRETGRPRGFAFVQMGSAADAEAAIAALDGQQLDGRTLRVSEARDRKQGSGGGRGFGNPRGDRDRDTRGGDGDRDDRDRDRGNDDHRDRDRGGGGRGRGYGGQSRRF